MCVEKLELSTLQHGLTLEILYPIAYAVMGAVINYVGKLALLGNVPSTIHLYGDETEHKHLIQIIQ